MVRLNKNDVTLLRCENNAIFLALDEAKGKVLASDIADNNNLYELCIDKTEVHLRVTDLDSCGDTVETVLVPDVDYKIEDIENILSFLPKDEVVQQ